MIVYQDQQDIQDQLIPQSKFSKAYYTKKVN